MFCPKCGTQNSDHSNYCQDCGTQLRQEASSTHNNDGVEFWETGVGPKNTDYYIKRFQKFSSGQGLISWNWPAFFVSFFWLLYRKMWAYSAVYFFAPSVLFFLALALFAALIPAGSAELAALGVQALATFILFPMFANALYYRVVSKRVTAAKAFGGDRNRQLRILAAQGGTSPAPLIAILVLIVPTIGILAAIAIPAYQDYTIRAQVAEGLNLAAAAKAAVAEDFFNEGEVPVNRTDAGMTRDPSDTSGRYVTSVAIENGRIDITYGRDAHASISGQTLSLTPYARQAASGEWSILWRCGAGSIPAGATLEISVYEPGSIALETRQYLPSACRP